MRDEYRVGPIYRAGPLISGGMRAGLGVAILVAQALHLRSRFGALPPGLVKDNAELAALEEHLPWCGARVDRAEATARYVDEVRAAWACYCTNFG